MDFGFTDEQEQFRQELRAFLRSDDVQRDLTERRAASPKGEWHAWDVYRHLGERGWLAVDWPFEYGGLQKTAIEAAIVSEEMCLCGVPDTVHVNTIDNVGRFLLRVGTKDQKRRFLSRMARGDLVVSVLYSEPVAGSDLAALETRAQREGSTWVLNGTKIFSIKTFVAEYGLCAARTGAGASKFAGLTLFMVPLRADGVEVVQIDTINPEQFYEVRFDGLQVPLTSVIGPIGGGWDLITTALSIERTGLDYASKAQRWLHLLIDHTLAAGVRLNAVLRHRLIELETKVEAGRVLAWRNISRLADGNDLDPVAAASAKWYSSELGQEIVSLALEIEGLRGTLSSSHRSNDDDWIQEAYREAPGLTLSAGTSEMMLYVIASNLFAEQAGS